MISLIVTGINLQSCNRDHDEKIEELRISLKKTMQLYDVSNYSFIIVSENNYCTENITDVFLDSDLFNTISTNFYNPVILDSLLTKEIHNEKRIIKKSFTLKGNEFQLKNIIKVKNDMPDLSNLDNDAMNFLTSKLINDFFSNKNKVVVSNRGMKEQYSSKNLFEKLEYFDKKFHALNSDIQANNSIPKLFPTWYVENTAIFFGYEVLQFGNIALLWNTFKDQHTEMLVVKNIEHNLKVYIIFPTGSLPTTNQFNRKDLLQSPLGIAITDHIINNSDEITFRAARQIVQHRKQAVEIERLKNIGNIVQSQNLLKNLSIATSSLFYTKYFNQPTIAHTGLVTNYSNIRSPFVLNDDTRVKIFAAGQSSPKRDYLEYTYSYDNIQLFINKETLPSKINSSDTKTFQFNFGLDYPDNQLLDNINHNNKKIEHAFDKYSNQEYSLEIKIPWSEIGIDDNDIKKSFSLNILSGDSDLKENERNNILALATDNKFHWLDVSKFKSIMLSKKDKITNKKNILARQFQIPPKIDGIHDSIWNMCESTPLKEFYQGSASPSDHQVKFKMGWDNENIYFLFTIMDNAINYIGQITQDKCWIINEENGELIWKLQASPKSKNYPTTQIEQDLILKAGSYSLYYTSDRTHSYSGWTVAPPTNDIYGAMLFNYLD